MHEARKSKWHLLQAPHQQAVALRDWISHLSANTGIRRAHADQQVIAIQHLNLHKIWLIEVQVRSDELGSKATGSNVHQNLERHWRYWTCLFCVLLRQMAGLIKNKHCDTISTACTLLQHRMIWYINLSTNWLQCAPPLKQELSSLL